MSTVGPAPSSPGSVEATPAASHDDVDRDPTVRRGLDDVRAARDGDDPVDDAAPGELHAERGEDTPRLLADGAVQPAQRQLGLLEQRHPMGRRQRGGRLGADQAGADDRHPPTRPLEAGKQLLEPCRVGVLVGDPDPGDGRPGRAQAGRPDELLERVLVELAARADLDSEPSAVEVQVDRPAVEVADAGRGKAVGGRQIRGRAANEGPLRERRAIAGQPRADQRHGDAALGQAAGARVPGDAVPDDRDMSGRAHGSLPSISSAARAGSRSRDGAGRTAGTGRSIQRYQAAPPTIAADVP